ncbi:hypothetical protein [Oceaniradius stylonematis]|uniref:hypothetical protein n=1 Tax=Oceaniradius stylonematis TaxID=2184161 RepID=UPI0035D04881
MDEHNRLALMHETDTGGNGEEDGLNHPGGRNGRDERPVYRLFGREFPKPGSRGARLTLGTALSVLGVFGFLPILGFWMIPLGLFILSHELHPLRRIRRRFAVRQGRKRSGTPRN